MILKEFKNYNQKTNRYTDFEKGQIFPGRGNGIYKTVFDGNPICNVTADKHSTDHVLNLKFSS